MFTLTVTNQDYNIKNNNYFKLVTRVPIMERKTLIIVGIAAVAIVGIIWFLIYRKASKM